MIFANGSASSVRSSGTKITLGTSVATGSLIAVPDSLRQAQGQLDGTLAAKAAAAADRGDRKAMAELQKYAGRVNDPEFVKTFLSKLGAKGITELPAALGLQVRANVNSTRDPQQVKQVQQVMKLLATTLAKGTNPKDEAFMGDAFLNQLVEEGRAEHKALEVTYVGYQAQALIWRASDGKPPFSERFMEVVGRDAILHQKELSDSRTPYANSMDLATVLGISDSMQPGGPRMGQPGEPIKASVIDDLAQAAQYSLPSRAGIALPHPEGLEQVDHGVPAHRPTGRLQQDGEPRPVRRAAADGVEQQGQGFAQTHERGAHHSQERTGWRLRTWWRRQASDHRHREAEATVVPGLARSDQSWPRTSTRFSPFSMNASQT
ncbi:hypothetical protein ACFSTC_03560 [Nonomuraea ferruginea]